MKYSEILRELIEITGLQLKYIAQNINYDISYISKWINDKNLPSLKQYAEINHTLAQLLTNVICKKNLQDRLRPYLPVELLLNSELTVYMTIATLLRDAYFYSLDGTDNDIVLTDRSTHLGLEQVILASSKLMTVIPQSANETTLIYTNLNVRSLLELHHKSYGLLFATRKSPLFKSWAISETPDDIENIPPEMFYMLITQTAFYDTNIYKNDSYTNGSFVYIKNKLLAMYTMDSEGLPFAMTVYTDKEALKEMDKIISDVFKREQMVMQCEYSNNFELEIYKKSLYKDNNFVVLLAYDNGLFLPEDLFVKVMKRYKLSPKNRESLLTLLRIQKDIMKKYKTNITINPNTYAASIAKREVNVGSYAFTLTEQEYAEYLNYKTSALGCRELEGAKLFIIRNDLFPNRIWDSNLTYFSTNEFVYLKKDRAHLDKNMAQYFYTMDKDFIKAITCFMEKLHSKRYFNEISIDQAKNFLTSIFNYEKI